MSKAPTRREFLRYVSAASATLLMSPAGWTKPGAAALVKPMRLRRGDTVGLINPAGATYQSVDIDIVRESLAALGLKVKTGRHLLDRYGYLAGRDSDRAADVNGMFADTEVRAILAVRGGWGCARVLPLLDYDVIRGNPKILMGYSDITALLLAVYSRSHLVTFHGPVGVSTWNQFSVDYVTRILFNGDAVTMQNPVVIGDNLTQTKDRVITISGGVARGRLVGGNLSVLAGIVGSSYLPEWRNTILFLEDDGEKIYRIDRMITELKLAGILQQVSGFIFGKCTNCGPGDDYGSLSLEDVMYDHIRPLGVPAWFGAMVGHVENKFLLPLGVEVEIDAERGTIRMLEPAVA